VDDSQTGTIGFVGAGRLGAALAVGLDAAGYRVTAVASNHRESAAALARQIGPNARYSVDPLEVAATADIVFLTVPDSAIAEVCASIPWEPRHLVVHCSGALGLEALATARARGAMTGAFHPLQTFPSGIGEPERFRGVFCGIEGAEPAAALLEGMAGRLGAATFRLEGVDRARYHLAAVFTSNLVVALVAAATRLWDLAGLERESGHAALSPLLVATAGNVSGSELSVALTGPVARGDATTVERHLEALAGDNDLEAIYRLLSAELLRLPLGHSDETVAELRRVLALQPGG